MQQEPIQLSGKLYPGLLTIEENADPMKIIQEFCNAYHQHEAIDMLWDWLVTAMGKNNSIYDVGKERSSLILFFEKINELIQASYKIHQKNAQPKSIQLTDKRNRKPTKKP